MRGETVLASHKVEVTQCDIDQDILEMHPKDVFYLIENEQRNWEQPLPAIKRG
jgi:NAD-dependent dihydropyrimidine dehydrogenase PreA subunit